MREGLSAGPIAAQLGYLRQTGEPSLGWIRHALHRYGINIPHRLRRISDDKLERLYITERLEVVQIAERLSWRTPLDKPSVRQIRARLAQAGIEALGRDGAPNPGTAKILRLHREEGSRLRRSPRSWAGSTRTGRLLPDRCASAFAGRGRPARASALTRPATRSRCVPVREAAAVRRRWWRCRPRCARRASPRVREARSPDASADVRWPAAGCVVPGRLGRAARSAPARRSVAAGRGSSGIGGCCGAVCGQWAASGPVSPGAGARVWVLMTKVMSLLWPESCPWSGSSQGAD